MEDKKPKLKWHTEQRKIDALIPFEKNPRKITDQQKEDLRKSLEKFDLVEIPAIDTDNKIVAGHQRLGILKLLGKGGETIDVRMPNRKLTDEEFKEYNLRSNKNVGGWDYDLLTNMGEELLLNVGFDKEELDGIFQPEIDDDKIPELPVEPKSKKGDIYQLGRHRLMCGDSTNKEDIGKLMNGERADMVFTSPPYNISAKMYKNYKDNLSSQEFINLHLTSFRNAKEFTDGFIFWNVSYNKNARWEFLEILYKIIKEQGVKFLELIIWDKGHGMPITSKDMLTRGYEDILLVGAGDFQKDLDLFYCGETKRAYFNKKNQRGITNYWRVDTNSTQRKDIKAAFPVKLPMKGIMLMSDRGGKVLDLFGGSGTTLIAAERLNRDCYMVEMDPRYCDVIIERWENITNKKAIKTVI